MASILEGGQLGRYEIMEQLGRGGMATVYKAYDPALDRYVAVKVLSFLRADDSTFLERFNREAQSIASLNHPNILQVYDIGDDKGFTYIVTEYVTGGTLLERTGTPYSLDDAVTMLRPLADALDYAHASGIVHRDIKPSNVLMKSDVEPILADFGLSRVMEEAYQITMTQEVIGTPEYMSPEQALGRDVDHRSDLYAFGILAYQLLVGEVPFHANTPAATMMAHIHQTLPLPDADAIHLDAGVKAVLLRATAKSPQDRFSSALEMIDALAASGGLASEAGGGAAQNTTMVLPTSEIGLDALIGLPSYVGAEPEVAASPWYRGRNGFALVGLASVAIIFVVSVVAFSPRFGDSNPLPQQPGNETPDGRVSVPGQEGSLTPITSENGNSAVATSVLRSPTPSIPLAQALASFDDTVSRVQRRVTSLRNLVPLQPIQTNLETRDKLADLADAHFKRRLLRDQVFETEELYKALGLMDEDADLEAITRDILMQQVSALFDDNSGRLYVLSDAPILGPAEELAYSSVYMAGMQEQLFLVSDLRRRAGEVGTIDEFRALTAFVGGDAILIQQGYIQQYFAEEQISALERPLLDNLLAASPDVVRESIIFPQQEGSNYVASLYSHSGNWDGINQIYSDLPISTEQIIHPEKYISRDNPVKVELPDLTDVFGRGWEALSQNTMGEFLIRVYLEQHLGLMKASDAAAGWGGDAYTLMIGPEAEKVFVLSTMWDTLEDSTEFFKAYHEFAREKHGSDVLYRTDNSTQIWWIGSGETTFLRQDGDGVLLILADDEALVRQAIAVLPVL